MLLCFSFPLNYILECRELNSYFQVELLVAVMMRMHWKNGH